jgi:tetratricopeptide (TPR) repeat protein
MAKKKSSKSKAPKRQKTLPSWAIYELGRATAAVGRGRWDEAREALETIDARCPRRGEVLPLLATVCLEQGDTPRLQEACRELCEIAPGDPEALLLLAQSYFANMHPVLALRTLDEFLRLHPLHEAAAEAREMRPAMREMAQELLKDTGLDIDEESAAWHEELAVLMGEGKTKEARATAQRLIERHPHFTPALNNLSQLLWADGQPEAAITTAWQALETAPDNVHALSNLVRFCLLSGREDDARMWAGKLKASRARGFDVWFKKSEALSHLGDDAGVLALWTEAQREKAEQSPGADAGLAHLAATAAWRLGRENEARKIWKKGGHDAANLLGEEMQANLLDLKKPVGERHAPWPFPIRNWIRESLVREIAQGIGTVSRRPHTPEAEERALRDVTRKQLQAHPELETIVPLLLDRGDPPGRQFALMYAQMARTPRLLEALRDFALGQRGPDEMRLEASQVVREEGVLTPDEQGCIRLWVQGEWRELMLMGFEVHDDYERRYSRSVENLLAKAHEQIRDGDGVAAELLVRRALEEYPDDPALLHSLAVAREIQGEGDEARRLNEELLASHPDYLFARTSLARLMIRDGDLPRAEELLRPLWKRSRLHHSEMAAWFAAQIELFLAQRNPDAAQSWLEMWEQTVPDAPLLPALRRRIKDAKKAGAA